MGWIGFLAVVPWIHAFIWALHDGITVDVRRGPKAQEKHIDEVIRKMKGEDEGAGEGEVVAKTATKAEHDGESLGQDKG